MSLNSPKSPKCCKYQRQHINDVIHHFIRRSFGVKCEDILFESALKDVIFKYFQNLDYQKLFIKTNFALQLSKIFPQHFTHSTLSYLKHKSFTFTSHANCLQIELSRNLR